MLKVLIVSSDECIKNLMSNILVDTNISYSVFRTSSVNEAISYMLHNSVSLFYIDICDSTAKYINLAKFIHLKAKYFFTPIIFFANNYELLYKAHLKINYLNCITKPFTIENIRYFRNFMLELSNNSQSVQTKSKSINLVCKETIEKVSLDEILYIEASQRKYTVHTFTNEITVTGTLKGFLENNCYTNLAQSHRAFLINVDNVKKLDKTNEPWDVYFICSNKTALLSKCYRQNILDMLFL